jgi:hypothetical protein
MDGVGHMKSAHGLPRTPKRGKRPSIKLTTGVVRALSLEKGKDDDTFFLPGFGVRLRASGSKTFIFTYGGRSRMLLGATSAISVAEARKMAERLYARVRLGEDPLRDKAAGRIKAAETFVALVGKYLAHQRAHLRPRT